MLVLEPGTRLREALDAIPCGGMLAEDHWRHRHAALSLVLLAHVPVILGYGLLRGYTITHSALDALLPLLFGLVAYSTRLSRGWRSVSVATGLIGCSVLLVHLSDGLTEAHFHFFVMVALLALYQDWKPFLVAIGVTIFEHGVTGVISPHSVYSHPDAWAHPWKWAFIHGGFVLAASAAGLTAWSISEAEHRRTKADTARLHARREEMLAHEANHDALTGLPNRRMILDHLNAAGARARAQATMIGVIFIDLDAFKQVNDTYGHVVGDAVLKVTAERLRAATRGADVAARLGGDEFLTVCEGLHNSAALGVAIHRIHAALSTPIVLGENLVVPIAASVGHVLATGEHDPELLIERADLDMYRMKQLRPDVGSNPAAGIPNPRR